MKTYKIFRVTDSFPPPWTGLSPATYELSAAQARQGCEVHVIAKYAKGANNVDQKAPFIVHRIRAKLIVFEIMAFLKFISLNKRYKFDLIHSHGSSFFFFHLLRKLYPKWHIFKIPVFVSVHNIREYQDQIYRQADFFSAAENILGVKLKELRKKKEKMLRRHKWEKIRQRVSYQDADCLLPVSEGLKNALINIYSISPQKIYTVYNGVSSFVLQQLKQIERPYIFPKKEKSILFVGRTIGTKNEVSLLLAMPKILNHCPQTKLILIGDGYWHSTLRQISNKLSLSENVIFIRHVKHEEIVNFYKSSDIFVFPSFSEGFPKVLLEAMACGLPIIATNVDGNNELVIDGYNGYLVPPNDPDSIAGKVVSLLQNEEKSIKLGENGRQFVLSEFKWEHVANRCSLAYAQCINKSSRDDKKY